MFNYEVNTKLYESAANQLKIIAHPIRLQIIKLLVEKGAQSVTQLNAYLHLPQPTLSQHLGKLKSIHTVNANRKGIEVYYEVADERVKNLLSLLEMSFLAG